MDRRYNSHDGVAARRRWSLGRFRLLSRHSLADLHFVPGCRSGSHRVLEHRDFIHDVAALSVLEPHVPDGIMRLVLFLPGAGTPGWLFADRAPWTAISASVAGTAATLTKATTFPAFAVVGGCLILLDLGQRLHARRGLPELKLAFIPGLVIITPFLIGYAWVHYSDHLKIANEFGRMLTSANLWAWNFGSLQQRLSSALWNDTIHHRVLPDLFGPAVPVAFVAFGAALPRPRFALGAILAGVGFLVPFLVFTNLHIVHNYYQYANGIFALAIVGIGVASIAAGRQPFQYVLAGSALIALVVAQSDFYFSAYSNYITKDYTKDRILRIAQLTAQQTLRDESIIVIGDEWSSAIPYYSQRKALVLATWFPHELLVKVFENPHAFLGDRPSAVWSIAPTSFPRTSKASPQSKNLLAAETSWQSMAAVSYSARRKSKLVMSEEQVAEFASWDGYCPICRQQTRFVARKPWFRDHLICTTCPGGSIPRERALMKVLEDVAPSWRDQSIHEGSPGGRGASIILARECAKYVPSQFFPSIARGQTHNGVRCEDLENQTFEDAYFDIVITQDVMEHVFHPEKAHQEIARTLKPGGIHIHTTPIYKDLAKTRMCARLLPDGTIEHLEPPEYHGNPVDEKGSLLTIRYGYDIVDLIAEWAAFDVELRRFHDRTHGIIAEFNDVIVCRRRTVTDSLSCGRGISSSGKSLLLAAFGFLLFCLPFERSD